MPAVIPLQSRKLFVIRAQNGGTYCFVQSRPGSSVGPKDPPRDPTAFVAGSFAGEGFLPVWTGQEKATAALHARGLLAKGLRVESMAGGEILAELRSCESQGVLLFCVDCAPAQTDEIPVQPIGDLALYAGVVIG